MSIILKLVNLNQKKLIKKMISDYERELTGEENPPEYKYLDLYWKKPNRKAYFIIKDSKIIGFALINQHRLVQIDGYNLAEFFVNKDHRLKGIGTIAAIKIFDLFPGKWETRELNTNTNARTFWIKVISDYTNNKFSEVWSENEQWNGWIQTFESPTK